MERYLFILGRKSELAFAELKTVLSRSYNFKISYKKLTNSVIVKSNKKLNPDNLINILGGTVKIVRLKQEVSISNLEKHLITILRNESIGKSKLIFGLSLINCPDNDLHFSLPKQIKSILEKENISSRYLLPRTTTQLTSAQVKLGNLIEIYLVWKKNTIEIGKTITVQDFHAFSKRDYGRPYVTPKEGMLPPKVAKMMVNLAFKNKPGAGSILLDPFCGTGTIAMESMILGINTISSDISKEKVKGTKKNLTWFDKQQKTKTNWQVLISDATKISNQLNKKIDCIVTEPFLGPPDISANQIDQIVTDLNSLYLEAFRDWKKILKAQGRVVITLPKIVIGNKSLTASLPIDSRENLGYTLVAGPFEYRREQTKVQRQIYVLEKI